MKKAVLLRLVLFFVAGIVPFAQALASTGHKVQVRDVASAQAIAVQGGRLIADYGGFQLYGVSQINSNLPPSAEVRDDYNLIQLNAIHLDTSTAQVQALRKTVGSFEGRRMHLVQFAGPVQPAWRQALLDAGVQIVSYIPQNAYLVCGDSASIGRVQAMAAGAPHVQWEGAYLDDYKIHPRARAVDKYGNSRRVFAIQLLSDAAANPVTFKLIDQLRQAPILRQNSLLNYVDVIVPLSAADLAKIAARPDVVSIQPYSSPKKFCERQDQIVAGNLSGNAPSGPGYLAWLGSKGFTQAQFNASGFVVDVTDSGIDNGTTAPNHFGLYDGGDINSPSRVAYNILEGTPNDPSTLAGCDGHGNINAHIVSGYDNSPGSPFEDSSGYHYGLGVCPFVSVGSSVIFDPDESTNPNDTTVIATAYHLGARISNNSWGDSDPGDDGTYNVDSQAYDALVRDAEPGDGPYPAAGNQEMVIVFAAGNDGPSVPSVSPPGTAKNVISVGGAQNVQPFGGCDGSDVCDNGADDANAIIDFSGRGPCSDGRSKPDLVAPCTHVSGGAPQENRTGPVGDGAALACFLLNGDGVSGGPAANNATNLFWPDDQQFYTASSGTSHSTPAVTGACALVRQYFINTNLTPPSPAMTKAFLMNSARYMTGSGADDTLWSESQGMGELDLGTAFDGTTRVLRDEVSSDMFTATGQTRSFPGTVGDPTKPFRVTIAWTDAPGNTTGNAYNNDLDLTVTIGGNTYKGNVFSGSTSITGGAADFVNNVESVFLPAGVSGNFTVTITAANINSQGVPNVGGDLNQDFALVIYNANAAASLAAGGYSLTTNEPCTDGVVNPGERVTVNLTVRNVGGSATSNLVATLLTSNGVVFPSGPQTYGALAPGAAGTNAFSFFADGSCGQTIAATLQLQDGTNDFGTVSYSFLLGLPLPPAFTQNFDGVPAGTLPSGWSSVASVADLIGWTTESTNYDTAPNAAYCPDSSEPGEVILYSQTISLEAGSNQLSFRNDYNLEDAYDGGVLEIAIGSTAINNGTFTDILTAGGSFVTGGYTGTITDVGDSRRDVSPLINRQTWTGDTGGFITTLANLPAVASGTNIQLRWICGTDFGNENLDTNLASGWWIDTVEVSQPGFECTSCPVTNVSVPTIVFPTNGSQLTTISPAVTVTGLAPPDSTIVISNNGVLNTTATADGNGVYATLATLGFGTNVLTASVGATNSSSNTIVVITLAPPTLQAPAVANLQVPVSGMGAPGATVYLYEVGVSGGPITNFLVNGSGNYSGSVTLPAGTFSLAATETIDGQTSGNSNLALVTVSVVTVAPPVIVSPTNGSAVSKASLTVSGTGVAGATVTVSDVTGNGSNTLATPAVNSTGKFSAAVTLADGVNTLSATQELNGMTSPASAPVTVGYYLSPVILVQPQSQTNFPKGTVTFSAVVAGAAPLKLFWETNGAKVRGTDAAKLTLSNLKTSDTEFTYNLVASNKYGVAYSSPVTLTLVANPFTNLAGAYYGLFAESNAKFESSGLLTLTLTSQGKFTAKILNAGGSYSFSGALSGVGWASNTISRGAAVTPLTAVLNLNVTNGMEQILGTVSDGTNWIADLEADRATFSAKNPLSAAGKFTLLFGNTNSGDGYGTVSVSTAGMVSLSGVLSDNTSVAPAAVSVSQYGRWPLYIPLYGKFGSLVGWIDFTNASFAGSNAMWFRTNTDGKLYPGGFTNALTIVGSTFTPAGNSALTTGLQAIISGGDLSGVLTNSVTLLSNGKFLINGAGIPGLTLSLTPSTGIIKGSFSDPGTSALAPVKGVVLQDQTNAGGFFLGGADSGLFLLTPP